MKKLTKFLAVLLGTIVACSGLFACGGGGDGVDETKTQIYISNYNGGFGDEWLVTLGEEFAALHEETSFEPGKKGVQIMISNHKADAAQLAAIKSSDNMVYFLHGDYYSYATQGLFADITDIVTEGGENSIESRLSADQKKYYTLNGGKYYALPREEGIGCMTYDIDLFEDYGLYFAKNGCPSEEGFTNAYKYTGTGVKSAGPDGKYNTADDGLPATYDEMFVLFDYMVNKGVIPMTWTGWYYIYYLGWIQTAMAVDYEGYADASINFGFDGTANHLVKSITANNNALFDDIEFEEPMTITAANGYEMYRSAGRYYAMKVLEKIVSKSDYYDYNNCFNSTVDHRDAQDNFLYSSFDNKPIAILLEGSWWENEAIDTFKEMEAYGMGRYERRLGVMPFPKVSNDEIGEATYYNTQQSMAFVNGTLTGDKLAVAKEFLKFVYQESSLRTFTTITGTTIAMNYTITDEQYNSLSHYGKQLYDIHRNGKIVQNFVHNADLIGSASSLEYGTFNSLIDGKSYNVPVDEFRKDNGKTALELFKGIQNNYTKTWWENNIFRAE